MLSVMFVLPVAGGSGGAHSVMQEAEAMLHLGVAASVAVDGLNENELRSSYDDLPRISQRVHGFDDAVGLAHLIARDAPTVVVATTNQSVHLLAEALRTGHVTERPRLAYYVQDYEPLFYEKGSAEWLAAFASYGLLPGMKPFAKTRWLQEVVEANHAVSVHKVEASVDHAVYFPDIEARLSRSGPLVVAAMVRPSTPRRAPRRTARLLSRVAERFGERVRCVSFGCDGDALRAHALSLQGVDHRGALRRADIGELFRKADLFLDLSDYQAFGRTALEAMSSGCVAVVPAHGGAHEFASHGRNAFIVDTRSDADCLLAVEAFVGLSDRDRDAMVLEAVTTGYRYSPERAALSEIELFVSL